MLCVFLELRIMLVELEENRNENEMEVYKYLSYYKIAVYIFHIT